MTPAELRVHHGEILMKFGEQLIYHGVKAFTPEYEQWYRALQVAIKGAMEIQQLRKELKEQGKS